MKNTTLLSLKDIDITNRRLIIREDFNVPLQNGKITSDARLRAALPTIQYALKQNAKIILLSHLGRPQEGQFDSELSLASVAKRLTELLNHPVRLVKDWLNGVEFHSAEIILAENVRFNIGEKNNDDHLAEQMAKLGDVFVMDAFATAHRAEASTTGIVKFIPIACAGPLLIAELNALNQALATPKKPFVAIVGGSKVSTKLLVLENLLNKVDYIILGGGIANTFLAAKDYNIGQSLYEANFIDKAKQIIKKAEEKSIQIILPQDVTLASQFNQDAYAELAEIDDISDNKIILDVGPKTIQNYKKVMDHAGTILWNGPVGVFEWSQFAKGTQGLAHAIAHSPAYCLAGGGDTIAAIEQFGITDKIDYISTGGGAFLEFIEGKTLPAIAVLQTKINAE